MRKEILLLMLAGMFMSQSYTVARFRTVNMLTTSTSDQQQKEVKYHVSVSGHPVYNTLTREYSSQTLDKMKSDYNRLSQKVFDREGFIATCVTNRKDASFLVDVKMTPLRSALPQEYCTGLTFGMIPSWGTRSNEYCYTFEEPGRKEQHSYYIDTESYNHLILFPVFWVNFITMDQSNSYCKALRNYLTHTATPNNVPEDIPRKLADPRR